MSYITEIIGDAACYEGLAEECSELAQAALKMARLIRKENPTRSTLDEVKANLIEEYTDIHIVAEQLGLQVDKDIVFAKTKRWTENARKKEIERLTANIDKLKTETIKIEELQKRLSELRGASKADETKSYNPPGYTESTKRILDNLCRLKPTCDYVPIISLCDYTPALNPETYKNPLLDYFEHMETKREFEEK